MNHKLISVKCLNEADKSGIWHPLLRQGFVGQAAFYPLKPCAQEGRHPASSNS